MPSPKIAKDIRDYLVNTAAITPVSIGSLADTPITQLAVIEYYGSSSIKTHGRASNPGGIVLDEAHIQVMARHTSAQSALTSIHAVVDALDGLADVTINSVFYPYVQLYSRPRLLDRQEDGSVIYIAEFRVQARR